MLRIAVLLFVYLSLVFAPTRVLACAGHLYLNPENMGFFGGAVARLAGLAPPEPVFDLEYVEMAKAVTGERSEIVVQFSRPFFSKDVRLQVRSTRNIEVLQGDFLLEERSGSVTIPFEVTVSGFETLTLTVTGEHKGETVQEYGRIYVSASPGADSAGKELQVSGRQ